RLGVTGIPGQSKSPQACSLFAHCNKTLIIFSPRLRALAEIGFHFFEFCFGAGARLLSSRSQGVPFLIRHESNVQKRTRFQRLKPFLASGRVHVAQPGLCGVGNSAMIPRRLRRRTARTAENVLADWASFSPLRVAEAAWATATWPIAAVPGVERSVAAR